MRCFTKTAELAFFAILGTGLPWLTDPLLFPLRRLPSEEVTSILPVSAALLDSTARQLSRQAKRARLRQLGIMFNLFDLMIW